MRHAVILLPAIVAIACEQTPPESAKTHVQIYTPTNPERSAQVLRFATGVRIRYGRVVRRVLALFMLAPALLGCVYDHESAITVYIIPDICTGTIETGPPVCSGGDYPADTSFTAIYEVGVLSSEFHSGDCSIEQIGEFELAIHISWSAKPSLNEQGVGNSFHECDDMTPSLAAGTWTIHHGSGSTTLEIPSTQADTACVMRGLSEDLSKVSCAELVWGE